MEKEKVDKAALGYDYKAETEKHQSQKGEFKSKHSSSLTPLMAVFHIPTHVVSPDYSKGFGGKFGVEKEKVDKAALGYDYKGETEKHQSQKGVETLTCPSEVLQRTRLIRFVLQIIQQASEVVMASRQSAWIRSVLQTYILFIPDSSGGRLIQASGKKYFSVTPEYIHSDSFQHHSGLNHEMINNPFCPL